MATKAKLYIAIIAALAVAILTVVASRWNPENLGHFVLFFALAMLGWNSLAAMMVVGACVYVVLNTGLVSLVISLAERCPLKQVWPSCYEWTFPYFLVGAAVAGLASAAGHGTNWGVTLLVVPVMYFVYVYYRMHMVRAVLENISSVSRENEAALAGASRG